VTKVKGELVETSTVKTRDTRRRLRKSGAAFWLTSASACSIQSLLMAHPALRQPDGEGPDVRAWTANRQILTLLGLPHLLHLV